MIDPNQTVHDLTMLYLEQELREKKLTIGADETKDMYRWLTEYENVFAAFAEHFKELHGISL